jgi:hypothetical protein
MYIVRSGVANTNYTDFSLSPIIIHHCLLSDETISRMSHHLNCTTSYLLISIAIPCIPDLRNRNLVAVAQYRSCSSFYQASSHYTNRSASRPCPASPVPSNPQRTCTRMHPFVSGCDLISSRFLVPPLPRPAWHFNFISRHTFVCWALLGCSLLYLKPTAKGASSPYPLSRVTRATVPCQSTQFQPRVRYLLLLWWGSMVTPVGTPDFGAIVLPVPIPLLYFR